MIGFIGAGNMGGAMIRAIAKKDIGPVYLYDVQKKIYDSFKEKNVICAESQDELIKKCRYIVLSVKPQYYQTVCEGIKEMLTPEHIVITVAPGITLEQMHVKLGDVKLVRTMPNTPALIGEGVTAYCMKSDTLTLEEKRQLETFLSASGTVFEVEEKQMDAVVAVSGSATAYGYVIIEAMADAAVSMGLSRDVAYEMAARTLRGSAQMVLETGEHPAVLKDAVTSPGGTTIAALNEMEKQGLRHSLISGMKVCYDKCQEIQSKS